MAKTLQPSSDFDICVRDAKHVHDIDSFKEWVRNSVRPLLPHRALACAYGRLYGAGVSLDYVVTIDYPTEHLTAIRNASGHMDTPLARRWFEQQAPVIFDASAPSFDTPKAWLENFRKHGLVNAAADGVLDQEECIASYFSFHQLQELEEVAIRDAFRALIPLLHDVFTRTIRTHQERSAPAVNQYQFLTSREKEIATWISQGKSNGDIASLLGVSENTIKNHVSRILDKTGCGNRAGLAAAIILQGQNQFGMGTKVL